MKVNLDYSNFIFFILLVVNAFFLFTFTPSIQVLALIKPGEINENSILLTESSRDNLQICSQQNLPLVTSFYVETANFFANICRKPNGQLIYIGGQKANPENYIKIAAIAEEGTGYVAEDGNTTYIVTGATLSIVENGKTISEEQVTYMCSQFSEKVCQER
ncbi:hypothetical protein [Okeania sp. SIO2B3]|uniref:hypothetical protein n=1 Tax=Okeania sp. SIO2B3 TaxID=2607784 RepID=UPI0013BEEF10|nr:hypothetical protein [Okeania sp. SIO2B3]NET40468.1 hypothetical protein [Okeania sp. SIO2B3]